MNLVGIFLLFFATFVQFVDISTARNHEIKKGEIEKLLNFQYFSKFSL